ncbi:hypothetical protein [Bathycoccus sp. RCC716 virus 3]|nr:hypothetical protein [Bathycoccus sp. RCC716 virus 3]
MHVSDILGWMGCTLLTVNIIPQIYKIHITKKVEDVSTTFIIINISGLLMYSCYAWYNNILHIAISTTISSLFSIYLLFLKCIYTLN